MKDPFNSGSPFPSIVIEKKNATKALEREEEKKKKEEQDWISDLPDSVLLQILSSPSISTREALSTSILSKRWRRLSTLISVLDFVDPRDCRRWTFAESFGDPDFCKSYMDMILKVLIKHENIQKFELFCEELCDPAQVEKCLSILMNQHKIQELDVYSIYFALTFPLTCQSLRVFTLRMSYVLSLPTTTSISFPSLKVLYLENVIFPNEDATERLFSGCPVLEKLSLDRCDWTNLKVINVFAPMLKCLRIGNDMDSKGFGDCEFKLDTPNLDEFEIKGLMPEGFDFHKARLLSRSYIWFCTTEMNIEFRQCARKFLKQLSNQQVLTVSKDIAEALFSDENLVACCPTFNNLIHLEICLGCIPLGDNTLLNLLQTTPKLESLAISSEEFKDDAFSKETTAIPQCLLSHLSKVEVHEFGGDQGASNMIEFFMTNSRVLKRMIIKYTYLLSKFGRKKPKIEGRILKIPRRSNECAIEFVG